MPLGVLNKGGQRQSSGNSERPSALYPSQFSSSGVMGGGEVVLVVIYLRQVAVLKCTFQF